MLFAIDIDDTIAGGCNAYKAYIEHHNQDLGLNISPHILEALPDYRSFLKLPEVVTYRCENEERFQASRASCRVSPQVILALEEIPDAVAGVTFLSKLGTIRYYTIRANHEATRQWLSIKQFPYPHSTVFCESTMHKLITMYHQETHESIILIDDRFTSLIQAFQKIAGKNPHIADNLQKRLILVAFGIDSVSEHTSNLKVLALPSWDQVASLARSELVH